MGIDVCTIPDSEEELDVAESDSDVVCVGERDNSLSAPQGSTPSSREQYGSPVQQQQTSDFLEGPLATSRQLYKHGVAEDVAATEARRRQLERTGKAPVIEQQVKQEDGAAQFRDRVPTQDEIDALAEQLSTNPMLMSQLSNGEGSSSNPEHVWRQRVYQAYLRHQDELLSQAQPRPQQSRQGDVEGAAGVPQPAAKRRRTMPSPAPPSGNVAGSSRQQLTPVLQQQQQQQQDDGELEEADTNVDMHDLQQGPGGEDEPSEATPRLRAVTEPQTAAQQEAVQQRQQQRPQPPQQTRPRVPAAAPAAAAAAERSAGPAGAAAAADGAGGSGRRRISGQAALTEKEKQRKLRRKLSLVEADAARDRDKLVDSSRHDLCAMLTDLEYLGNLTERPREAAQHAGVLSSVLRDGVDMITSFSNITHGRAPEQLTRVLKLIFAADAATTLAPSTAPADIHWAQLGAVASRCFRPAPGVGSMLGALAGAAKARAKVVRQKRQAPEPEERPMVGPAALEGDHGLGQETERVVTEMRRQLEGVGSCTAMALVLDHDSFAHTLENVFALSFLCKDMYVRLELDRQRGLMVHHISRREREQLNESGLGRTPPATAAAAGRLTPHQFVMELDMSTWRDMCRVVPRANALMPQRSSARHDHDT